MTVEREEYLWQRIRELEDKLAQRTHEVFDKERQLERYAADLKGTFIEEQAGVEELRGPYMLRSYMLTVRALASAVEGRDGAPAATQSAWPPTVFSLLKRTACASATARTSNAASFYTTPGTSRYETRSYSSRVH